MAHPHLADHNGGVVRSKSGGSLCILRRKLRRSQVCRATAGPSDRFFTPHAIPGTAAHDRWSGQSAALAIIPGSDHTMARKTPPKSGNMAGAR